MAEFACMPSDLDRLKARMSSVDLSNAQRAVLLEVALAAVDSRPLEPWKDIARRYGMDPGQLSRAKALLGLKIVETDDGLRVNLDNAVWFEPNTQGQAFKAVMQRIAKHERDLPASGSENTSNSRNGQSDKQNCQVAQITNSTYGQFDNPPGPPIRKTHAGANSFVCSSDGIQSNERTEGEGSGEGEPDEVRIIWTDEQVAKVAPWVTNLFKKSLGQKVAESLGAELAKACRGHDPEYLFLACQYVTMLARRDLSKIKTVYGLIVSLSLQWEKDEMVPSSVLSDMERDRAMRRKARVIRPEHMVFGPGHPAYSAEYDKPLISNPTWAKEKPGPLRIALTGS